MKRISALIILASLFVTVNSTFADAWLQMQKFLASDGAALDYFGCSVAISGNYAIVGSYQDDDLGDSCGAAYIFQYDGTAWTQQCKLVASDGAAWDYFGFSVAIDGNYAIVGAYEAGGCGAVYIFRQGTTAWTQQCKLVASDGAAGDCFGFSVAIDGNYVIAGAMHKDTSASDCGAAYIFYHEFTSWIQQAKLLADDGAAGDNFGRSVAISGDYAIVGANLNDDIGNNSGSAYIFKRNGTAWAQQVNLTASDGAEEGYFGISVAMDGDYAIVGAHLDDDMASNCGSAYLFKRDGKTWPQQIKLIPFDGDVGDFFGCSVGIDGDYAIVGSSYDDDMGINSGTAYIFKRNIISWSLESKIAAADGELGDRFGSAVAISGHAAIAGAYYDDDNGSTSGSAYLFGFSPDADLNKDCKVDLADFAKFAEWWLYDVTQ